VIPRLTATFAALPLTPFVLAVLPPFLGCFPGASEFELPSHVQGDVGRVVSGAVGTVAVIDVESGKILAAKKLDFAGKQLVPRRSTRKPFVLMELLGLRETGSEATIYLPSAASHRGVRLDCGPTGDLSQLADDAIVDAGMVAHSVSEDYR
jgi:hypothetical protein